jgi:hypothetical protein
VSAFNQPAKYLPLLSLYVGADCRGLSENLAGWRLASGVVGVVFSCYTTGRPTPQKQKGGGSNRRGGGVGPIYPPALNLYRAK